MTVESFLSNQLQKFSIIDLILVKWVYVVIGLLVVSLYSPLLGIDWWFYLLFSIIAAFPLWIHLFSQKGSYFDKTNAYLKSNTPPNQVLLFLSCFFFAAMLSVLLPMLINGLWWYYVIVMVVLAIKPLTKTWCW